MAQKFNFDKIDTEGNPSGYILQVSNSGSAEWALPVFGSGTIDSIQARELYESIIQNLDISIVPAVDSVHDVGSRVRPFKRLYLDGEIFLGETRIRDSDNTAVFVNAKGKEYRIGDFNTQALVDLIDSAFINNILGDVTGPQGIQGVLGAAGDSGIQGTTTRGTFGTIGVQGPTGPSGPQGVQGLTGIQGSSGIIGPQGIQGSSSIQGFVGPQGVQGVQGSRGCIPDPVQGTTGCSGIQGIQGFCGADGTQGIQGVRGSRGPQGIQGIQGIQGSCGIQGTAGIQGPRGETGNDYCQIQGTRGLQGFTGADGIQGVTGFTSDPPNCLKCFDQSCETSNTHVSLGLCSGREIDGTAQCALGVLCNTAIGVESLVTQVLSTASSSYFGKNTAVGYRAGWQYGGTVGCCGSGRNCDNTLIGAYAGAFNAGYGCSHFSRNTFVGNDAGSGNTCAAGLGTSIGIYRGGTECNTYIGCLSGAPRDVQVSTSLHYVARNVAIGHGSGRPRNSRAGVNNNHFDNVDIGCTGLSNACCTVCGNVNIGYTFSRGNYNICCNARNTTIGFNTATYGASAGVAIGCNAYTGACGGVTVGHRAGVGECITSCDRFCSGYYTFIGTRAGCAWRNCNLTGCHVLVFGTNALPSSASAICEVTLGNSNHCAIRAAVTSISSLSDCRDKTCIQSIPYGIDFIKSVRPVQFQWNRRREVLALPDSDDDNLQDVHELGFIAQELSQVENQFNSKDFTQFINDNDSNRLEANPVRMYPIVIKAIQDLSNQIDRIKQKIENASAN